MPGTNLTREEANARAELLAVTSYTVELDLTTGPDTFGSTTRLEFTCARPGAETFADLVDADVHEIVLNGTPLDPATAYADSRITLPDLRAENVLVVRADCTYSRTGEGLHRFVDPADDRVYLYSQFEVPDARRVFTTFEQPDLKSPFTFHVTAPAHWQVVSNARTPEPVSTGSTTADGDPAALWRFEPTKPMSTYITAIVAGEYHCVTDVYSGVYGDIPLGHYCRQSLAEYLDVEELVAITKQGFAYFEKAFGYPYPFGKYDQLYVPEYNMGAMENAGCVTFRDEYLPRSRQSRSFYEFRASVILHEMAHMWFGNLVTMKWWDDLWLNESFAEWACYHAAVQATSYDESWTGFCNARKVTGYRQDQLPSTHPIAADNYDLEAVEVNFDMITYAKGASVLKQLVAWVGLEPFLAGLRAYFAEHEYANTEFADLLDALERSSGRELRGWADEWLRTAGVNTLSAEFTLNDDGTYATFAVRQTATEEHPTLRRHRIGIGLYNRVDGQLVRTEDVEVDIDGELTRIDELCDTNVAQPDLLLLNDQDLAYAKIRLDDRSLATVVDDLGALDDSLARALCWTAAWDMTRDGEMAATDFVALVRGAIGAETDAYGVSMLPRYAAMAVNQYSAPATRAELRDRWEDGTRQLLAVAEPGSDQQLSFARAYAAAARTDPALEELEGLLDGSVSFQGLEIDADMRWTLLTCLAARGRVGEAEIAAELERDRTISGQEKAAGARAARPDAAAKAAAWEAVAVRTDVPNETQRSIATAFIQPDQDEVLAPYLEKYLRAAETIWDDLGVQRATTTLRFCFPTPLASPELLERVDAWLESSTANPGAKRYVAEGRAEAARALAAQRRDAQADG